MKDFMDELDMELEAANVQPKPAQAQPQPQKNQTAPKIEKTHTPHAAQNKSP